jgi:protein-arginine kinase activator protein McsA
MTAEKKCAECRKEGAYLDAKRSNRLICRSCYLAHLKRLVAIYGMAGSEETRAEVLVEIRRVEEDQR